MISPRLAVCAQLVRSGAVLADVGTDHAYLPIHLLSLGKIERAVASDINEGPLEKARTNVMQSGFSDKACTVLTNGAAALSESGATDYAI